jgi:hypothetical protein
MCGKREAKVSLRERRDGAAKGGNHIRSSGGVRLNRYKGAFVEVYGQPGSSSEVTKELLRLATCCGIV